MQLNAMNGQKPYPAYDPNVRVEFFYEPVWSKVENKHVDKLCLKMMVAGDRYSVVTKKATDEDLIQYEPLYRAFMTGAEAEINGTPLRMWARLTPAQIKNLQQNNVMNVEALANLPDARIETVGLGSDARTIVKEAKHYLEVLQPNAAHASKLADLEERISNYDTLMRDMKDELSLSRARNERLQEENARLSEAPEKNKGGRPRKVKDDAA